MKQFHISDILSITDGRLVSTRHMDGVYDILNYMTGQSLYTHQLPDMMRVCGPVLLHQHPQLANLIDPDEQLGPENYLSWVSKQVDHFGAYLPVEPLGSIARSHIAMIDPIEDLADKIGTDNVIVVNLESHPEN